ncbi:MAG: FAD-dependent oxidoreductase [Actinomycetes bacterium]|jgi:pyruvate/2-oxoglutarate dehydrogenase complex dihydrolipoamide dehydrogenase (E3) component|nr:MAG: NADPH:quinone reductase [Actinomycetota bacterium]
MTHLLIIGGGPAGTQAATVAAARGARVTLVEKEIVGGAAHLLDCIPSKTMSAAALRYSSVRNAVKFGLMGEPSVPSTRALGARIDEIVADINQDWTELLASQGVEIVRGSGRFVGPHEAVVETEQGERRIRFDKALISTGSRPRVPDWAPVDGERILTTRDCYHFEEPPPELIVIGSGVTGVEFTHIFEAFGSEVTLVVSRRQILPHRDPEVAAVLEEDFQERGVKLVIGARAEKVEVEGDRVVVYCDDGRRITGTHALLAVGSVPNSDGLGLEDVGVETDSRGFIRVDEYQRTTVPHIYAAGDVTGQMLLSSVATAQGRKIAWHALGMRVEPLDLSRVAEAIFTEPEIASVGLVEVEAAAVGRKVRTTKVPFASNARSVLQNFQRGFVKITIDPATDVVLGGTIVGHRASELIGVIALAVQARVTASTLLETLMAHPTMVEAITDAVE